MPIQLGSERLLASNALDGLRVGVVCNPASVDARYTHVLTRAAAQDWSAALPVLQSTDRLFVIGRGTGLAVAMEAALKLKETSGIQAEAFSGAEVKHGPMALVRDGYPLLVFAPRGPAQAGLLAIAEEMSTRGGRVLLAAQPQAEVDALAAKPELLSSDLMAQPDLWQQTHRRVRLHGTWLTEKTVLLDNRNHQCQSGFWVLTPLQWQPGVFVRRLVPPASYPSSLPVRPAPAVRHVAGLLGARRGGKAGRGRVEQWV